MLWMRGERVCCRIHRCPPTEMCHCRPHVLDRPETLTFHCLVQNSLSLRYPLSERHRSPSPSLHSRSSSSARQERLLDLLRPALTPPRRALCAAQAGTRIRGTVPICTKVTTTPRLKMALRPTPMAPTVQPSHRGQPAASQPTLSNLILPVQPLLSLQTDPAQAKVVGVVILAQLETASTLHLVEKRLVKVDSVLQEVMAMKSSPKH